MENAIEIKKLTKKYPGFTLEGINLSLPKGTIMGFIGENGAGKSTTIKTMLNIIPKNKGEVNILGKNMETSEKRIKEEIGVVLDDSFLSDYLTLEDIDKIMKQFYQKWDKNLFYTYSKQFNLPKGKKIKEYSTGMKMKLKIATALSHHPKLLILDEPTSGLDPVVRSEMLDIFRDFIQDDQHSIFLSSHITSDLEHIADYITFIHQGKIILSKSRDELLEQYGVARCSQKDFETINPSDYLHYKKNRYQVDVLVENRTQFKKKYQQVCIDKPSIEDIMLLSIKGDK
jgi:ABC-2 type transport system ATP-binding protein